MPGFGDENGKGCVPITPTAFLVPALVIALCAGCASRPPARLTDGTLRFSVTAEGVVEDRATGLTWTQDPNTGAFEDPWDGLTWEEANRFVADMNAGLRPNMGYTDWRLPTVAELQKLTAGLVFDERTMNEPFKNLEATAYWSATQGRRQSLKNDPSSGDTEALDYAWAVDTAGTAFPQGKSARRRLWPVRGVNARDPLQ